MKTFTCLFILLSFFSSVSYAQLINGEIFDATNKEGLPGAVILNLNDSTDQTSNLNGEFSITIDSYPTVLQITHVGYKTLEFNLKEYKPFLNIGLNSSDQHLNEIIIQATRFNRKLMDIPAAVNAISDAELKRSDETIIMPAINRVPGVFMESGSLNTNRISIRGIGSKTPYSTNRVRAYFNDIPLTTGEGESTLEDIDLNALQRVEIIKGPASSIYGAGLGGTINLISRAPEYLNSQAQAKFISGSYGLRNTNATLSYSFNEGYVNLSLNDLHSDGYRENSEYDRKSVTINSTIYNDANLSMSFLGSFIDLKSFIPSSIDKATFEESPESAATNWAEAEGYEAYIKSFAGFSLKYDLTDNFSQHSSLFFSFRDADEPRPFDILKENTVAAGLRTRFEYQNDKGLHAQLGGEVFSDWYSWSTYENLYRAFPGEGSVLGSLLSNNKEQRSYYNMFFQLKWELNTKISLEGGINYNSTTYSLNDLYTDDAIDQSGDYAYDPIFSPRLGIIYTVADNWNLYGSVSHGFSMPSLAETLTPEGLINPEIKPETGVNYEIGTKGHWLDKRLYGELSLYRADIDNLLVAERVGPDRYIGVNAGKTTHDGVELMINYQLLNSTAIQMKPFLSLTVSNYRFEEYVNLEVDYSGNQISGFPSEIINTGFDLQSAIGLYFFGEYRYVGSAPLNDLNTLYNEEYSLVNFKAGYKQQILQSFTIDLKAGVNNLFDADYASMILVNAVGFGNSSPRYYYPGLPRNYFFGLSLDYNF